ncbi:BMC domain-containing protein [Crassaminicella thermophila]|uniref:BMC domain-containing protein n=1 Tax=Crassaminicella thermophila TaxID=2599308 RepID=A0A5C0SIV6_CRATE|nr:BMC domain-containing protein [Crassaminicella thermophila]
MKQALGFIETYGYIGALEAADACLKAANVEIVSCNFISGGLVTIIIQGDVSSVKEAIDVGSVAANRVGEVISVNVIARAGIGLEKVLCKHNPNEKVKEKSINYKGKKIEITDFKELKKMKVVELRRIARQIDAIGIERKQIKFAKKDELIRAIMNYFKGVE